MKTNITLLLSFLSFATFSQVPSPVFDNINANNINASISNSNAQFWEYFQNAGFEVPAGSGKTSIYASAFWIGGTTNNNTLHFAGNRFQQQGQDFYPGPIMDSIHYASQMPNYNRIYSITCDDIQVFKAWYAAGVADAQNGTNTQAINFPNYTVPQDIIDWPAHGDLSLGMAYNLAEFVDVSGDGFYNHMDGDYPKIKGDEFKYFILNDDNLHTETGGNPMRIEIHVSIYAYSPSDTNHVNHNIVYMNYRIINRSQDTYYNSYVGVWTDLDIGGANDDYVGSFPLLSSYYGYNGDAYDESSNGAIGYFDTPPAVGVSFIGGPWQDADGIDNLVGTSTGESLNGLGYGDNITDNERLGMSKFLYHNVGNGAPNNDPTSAQGYYNYLRGIWTDGSQMVFGGNGTANGCFAPFSCNPASFMFDGGSDTLNINTGQAENVWSEVTAGNSPGDRRGVGSMGPFTFLPNQEHQIDIAYVFAQNFDTNQFANSVDKLEAMIQEIPALDNQSNCTNEDCNAAIFEDTISSTLQLVAYYESSLPGASNNLQYLWSDGSTQQTLDLSSADSGQYCVTITDLVTGCESEACYNLVIYSCSVSIRDGLGGSFLFVDESPQNPSLPAQSTYSYEWNNGDTTAFLNLQFDTISQVYCVTVTNLITGCISSDCHLYNPNSSSTCQAAYVTYYDQNIPQTIFLLNIADGDSLSYLWDFGDGTTSNDSLPTHVYANSGLYEVCLTITEPSGCTSSFCDSLGLDALGNLISGKTASGFTINVVGSDYALSNSELTTQTNLKLYPNPTSGELNLSFTSTQNSEIEITISDVFGKTIETSLVIPTNQLDKASFDLSNFSKGVYLVTGKTRHGQLFSKPIIKQ